VNSSWSRREFLQAGLVAGAGLSAWNGAEGQERKLAPGVETKLDPVVTGEERIAQPDLWVLEVNFKPLRMIAVDMPDGDTGKTVRKLIWYLCYRAVNRPIAIRAIDATTPVYDIPGNPPPKPPIFVPEFTLVTTDNNQQERFTDRVMPVAQAAIIKRERQKYLNSVEVVGPIPDPTPVGKKPEKSIYGVATWRGVNPESDRFRIFMTGFSNGYQVIPGKDANDPEIVQRKTIVQEYWRPGDEFEQKEFEIRSEGPPKWIYR
jgi:hypothetical protein